MYIVILYNRLSSSIVWKRFAFKRKARLETVYLLTIKLRLENSFREPWYCGQDEKKSHVGAYRVPQQHGHRHAHVRQRRGRKQELSPDVARQEVKAQRLRSRQNTERGHDVAHPLDTHGTADEGLQEWKKLLMT